MADGDFSQWVEGDRLHVKITYALGSGNSIEETSVFRQRPQLMQEQWSFREQQNGEMYRQFEVNFTSRTASASKREDGALKKWSDTIDVEPGRTFAGFGFSLAIRAFRPQLIKGERIELHAVGFTPQPRLATVELSYAGVDDLHMADRTVRGDRFVVHPKIPWYAKLFVKVPDTHVWLATPAPAGFLRWEGPLAEPGDAPVRVDVLPGGRSS